jgi:hypothetical protein
MRYRKTLEKFQFKLAFAVLAVGAAVTTGSGVTNVSAAEPARVSAAEPARVAAAELEREAHDTYCIACHDTKVYTRGDRLARNYDELRAQVVRWHSNLSLKWSDEEIDRMTAWLAKHYYKMECSETC